MENELEVLARLLIRRDTRILLCRNKKRGYTFLPGGHVEFGEDAAHAVRRECQEEFGAVPRVHDLAAVIEQLFVQDGRPRHEYSVLFRGELAVGEEVVSRERKIEFVWVEEAELESARLLPAQLAQVIREAKEPGTRWYSFT